MLNYNIARPYLSLLARHKLKELGCEVTKTLKTDQLKMCGVPLQHRPTTYVSDDETQTARARL